MGKCDGQCRRRVRDIPEAADEGFAKAKKQIAVDMTGKRENEPLLSGTIAVAKINADTMQELEAIVDFLNPANS